MSFKHTCSYCCCLYIVYNYLDFKLQMWPLMCMSSSEELLLLWWTVEQLLCWESVPETNFSRSQLQLVQGTCTVHAAVSWRPQVATSRSEHNALFLFDVWLRMAGWSFRQSVGVLRGVRGRGRRLRGATWRWAGFAFLLLAGYGWKWGSDGSSACYRGTQTISPAAQERERQTSASFAGPGRRQHWGVSTGRLSVV